MEINKKLAISDSGFIFDPTTGESYSLNEAGLQIIRMLKENRSQDEIKNHFLSGYNVDEVTFERSYLDFISMLRYYNLLKHEE